MSNSWQPVDCSPPSSSVHGILQARILEWVAISFSRGSSQPRDRTQASHIAGRCFNLCTTREALKYKNTVSQKTYYRDTELLYNIVVVFAIYWHESALGVHVSLILNPLPPPSPSHPPGLSQRTSFECPVKPELKETHVHQCSSQHCL